MRWAKRLADWAGAGAPARPERRRAARRRGYSDPLAFTIDLAADLRAAWLGGGVFAPRVSRQEALSVPSVKRVRDLTCATLGTLELVELDLARRPVTSELLEQPEPDIPRSITYTNTAEDMLFEGHAWWRVLEFTPEGWPRKVRRLLPRSVIVRLTGEVYVSSVTGETQGLAWEFVPDAELIRFDSPWPAMLTHGARTIRDAMAVARAASRNVENPVPQGYFSPKSTDGVDAEDPPDAAEILADWRDAVDQNATPYLNGALEFHQVAWNPEQLQFKETRDATVLEVARLGNVDPEELGVSTTTRTYANAEQRRLDLIDFTIAPLLVAMQDRLSMGDVTFPGHRVQFVRDGFLRSDTLTRMQVYQIGRKVGAYDDQRVAEVEGLPVDRVVAAREQAAALPATPSPAAPDRPPAPEVPAVSNSRTPPAAAGFAAAPDGALRFGFDLAPEVADFKADVPTRTISGLVLPWNVRAQSGGYTWEFAPGSLHWSADSRVKLDLDHQYGSEFGRATALRNTDAGLAGSFQVARGQAGDDALFSAEDGVYDGLSAFVTFDGKGDGYEPHPEDPGVRRVYSATLRKVALTAMPAFDDARVQSVAANQNGGPTVTAPVTTQDGAGGAAQQGSAPAPVQFDAQAFADALTAGLAPALSSMVVDAIRALPSGSLAAPTRQVVPAGGARVVREAPVYMMNGQGASFVRDAWRSRTQGDDEARDRLLKFERMTSDMVQQAMLNPAEFALNTGNANAVVPPGFRPDMYVSQLLQGRPLVNLVSRGTISDATPFKIPMFVSSSGATATHVEGTNPSDGSLSVGTITVSPGGISGKYTITREIADSSNPAIDAIATQAMSESWSQQTEAQVYAKLNGSAGVGGTITSGFVPSGAQAYAVTDNAGTDHGTKFLAQVRQAMANYPFRRFGSLDWAVLSQEGTTTFAGATDSTGRPLLPWVGPQNVIGTANTQTQGYLVDGLTYQPAWSLTGNTSGDADVIAGNRNDAWCWESPVLNFRFEEVSGPANVVLALFGYFAVEVLRPIGLVGIRLTVT